METITIEPSELAVVVQETDIAVTVRESDIAVAVQETGAAVNVNPTENVVNILTGATIINNYTSGGKLTVEFDYADFPSASLLIGEITSGRVIINTVVEVDTAFDAGYFTIGKDSAQAILMAIADRGNEQGRYLTHNYIELTATDNYKIFFSGSPTTGSGKVYITFA